MHPQRESSQWGNNVEELQTSPAPQVSHDPMAESVTNAKFHSNFQMLAQVAMTQANHGGVAENVGTLETRL